MIVIANKSCLQKPRSQTWPQDKAFYRPHIVVESAAIQQECYCQSNSGKMIIAKESAKSLRRWLKQEEQGIDNHLNTISQELRSA